MNWVAWKMLTGDKAKYAATIFGVAFGTLLISQQTSIFVGLMRRTASQILDVREASIWVMDPQVENSDEIRPISDNVLHRVRGVPGVEWAVPLYKGNVRIKVADGKFRQGILMGLDDASLVGAPSRMIEGTLEDLKKPDGIVIDKEGYALLFPGEPQQLGRELEMNDRRAVIVGICKVSSPFQTFPVMFARYGQAMKWVPPERNRLSFILAEPANGVSAESVARSIGAATGLSAWTRIEFAWKTVEYYMKNTGIPVNFGITIGLGFIVGTAIAGQTFYLFTLENLRQFGSLKAMGLSNLRLIGMILLQAGVVGAVGYGLGIGMTALFFEATRDVPNLVGFFLPWQVAAMSAATVLVISVLASLLSIRKVLVLEPAVVFRS